LIDAKRRRSCRAQQQKRFLPNCEAIKAVTGETLGSRDARGCVVQTLALRLCQIPGVVARVVDFGAQEHKMLCLDLPSLRICEKNFLLLLLVCLGDDRDSFGTIHKHFINVGTKLGPFQKENDFTIWNGLN
jgi:hypothetical protein